MQLGLLLQVSLQLFDELVIVADHLQISLDVQPGAVLRKAIENVTIASVLERPLEGIVVVLMVQSTTLR